MQPMATPEQEATTVDREANVKTGSQDIPPSVSATGECHKHASAKRKKHEHNTSDELEEFWNSLPEVEDDFGKQCCTSLNRDRNQRTGPVSDRMRQRHRDWIERKREAERESLQ